MFGPTPFKVTHGYHGEVWRTGNEKRGIPDDRFTLATLISRGFHRAEIRFDRCWTSLLCLPRRDPNRADPLFRLNCTPIGN